MLGPLQIFNPPKPSNLMEVALYLCFSPGLPHSTNMPPGNTARGVKRGEMMMFSKHFRMNLLQQMRMTYLHIFEETQIENVSSMLDDFHYVLTIKRVGVLYRVTKPDNYR